MTTWSYSSITLFEQCPKKYFHLRVEKDFKEPESEQMKYGTIAHKAAEDYVREDIPLPPQFSYMTEMLDKLKNVKGEKLCEYKLGVRYKDGRFTPCEFFSKDVWWRGIADLIILDREKQEARVIDYKTGKSAKYADTKQLKLISAAIFLHFPEIRTIKAGLLFVVSKEFIKDEFSSDFKLAYFEHFMPVVKQLESCHTNGVWNAKRNFTCSKWCSITTCPHNGS